ncbi:hypothetical protein TVAG_252950 [Trichomonas vaginalis G3]|uniref:EamA domain-containing protein n=1 Tax=Trichomonas vaginalis (strain ATCC PRA-98 / G3) TaxID=412133 RepID=A2EXF4_TRIV3|nr:negative regulation of mitochondrial outer membrane permeabilization protein [Trichomonas vaginalis G3]EAY02644.1 hypothetical protein TVAG_252950 [Trichomonas vaginalis G3]KAI5550141.1 negative regulation of mitochondrial outer membrane permeabilization protein [Trichomonas vaginalis G3]|eukprot:XP_001314867.1 hypothetical protein [Trichomonas vaginalis G3]
MTVVVYNVSGMYVTSFSSAIHRNIYESLRTSVVWVLLVIIHYAFPNSGSGEGLSIYSLVELLGFLISILGSFIYNEVIKINCFGSNKDNKIPLLAEN